MSIEPHGGATDPYRVFFPLGILAGLAGVSIWALYYFGITSGYSGRAHAFVQTCGFLYSFAAGFLLTAIPRFTGTSAPSRKIQYLLAALLALTTVAFELEYFLVGNAAFLLVHLMVIGLAVTRFVHRKQNPPATFALIGVGLMSGIAAAVINTGVALDWIAPSWDLLGRRLMTEGMFLMLVLGVGGFLGPRLLGFAAMPNFTGASGTPKKQSLAFLAAGIVILGGLVADYGFQIEGSALIRALASTAVISVTTRPWRFPAVRTTLSWCVWSANVLLIAGVWLVALAPRYRADFLHVMFIAFTLLILAVGTRVVLSHGGYPLALEKKSWPLRIGLVLALIAMAARTGAPFAPAVYFDHLAYAALLWMAGISVWGIYLMRLLRGRPD